MKSIFKEEQTKQKQQQEQQPPQPQPQPQTQTQTQTQMQTQTQPFVDAQKRSIIREWLEKQNLSELENHLDEVLSISDSSIVSSSLEGNSETDLDILDEDISSSNALGTQSATTDLTAIVQNLKELFNSVNSVQTVGNVNITNSTGVHIGNITNINGNIQIIQQHIKSNDDVDDINDNNKVDVDDEIKKQNNAQKPKVNTKNNQESEECVSADAFLNNIKIKIPKTLCAIVPRYSWLAQEPMEKYEYMKEPVEYVVICHTATESSEKTAINKRIIRDAQSFHIESRGWNDIAYNFLIGCDGNCYEGRGWGVIGAHTLGYNSFAIGISFIGCFMRVLPTDAALNACRNLLEKGVKDGHLAVDYKLICHCQCVPFESPGRRLYEELQTWPHFHHLDQDEI